MQKFVFATNNQNKLTEVKEMLKGYCEVAGMNESGFTEDIPETADTLEGNAAQKAQYIHEKLNCSVFADDTGLEIDVLNGEPGVFSARYAGADKDAKANMRKVLEKLQGVENRKARFRTAICLIMNDKEFLFEGIVEGSIIESERGAEGFGYDPIFQPDGFDQTFAEMDMEAKNQISHRGRAIQKLVEFLKKSL